jgi:hypothetical protein
MCRRGPINVKKPQTKKKFGLQKCQLQFLSFFALAAVVIVVSGRQ